MQAVGALQGAEEEAQGRQEAGREPAGGERGPAGEGGGDKRVSEVLLSAFNGAV